MSDLLVRLARQSDAPRILEMITESFDGVTSRFSAIGQPGYSEYLYESLGDSQESLQFYVAEFDGVVVAFVDLNAEFDGSIFLTRICVSSSQRGRGLAKSIIYALDERLGGNREWILDVFVDNSSAVKLYRSLGLDVVQKRVWVHRPLDEIGRGCDPVDHDVTLGDFWSSYTRFGFGRLLIEDDVVSVAGSVARCGHATYASSSRLATLRSVVPEVDTVAHVGPADLMSSGSYTQSSVLAVSQRMAGYLPRRSTAPRQGGK